MGRRAKRLARAATSSVNLTALISILVFSGMILFFASKRDSDEVAQIALGVVGTAFGAFIVNLVKLNRTANGPENEPPNGNNGN